MAALKQEGVQAVVLQPNLMGIRSHHRRGADGEAAQSSAIFPIFAVAGGLLTYGIDDRAQMHAPAISSIASSRAPSPADLPIELPTDYVLIVNQKTAAEFGLTIPNDAQAATEVID